jgi:hypothetical protein
MSLAIKIRPEPVRTRDFSTISNVFMGIGTVFTEPVRILFIQNHTNQLLAFSFDGVNTNFVLAQDDYLLLDATWNRDGRWQGCFVRESRVYVKYPGAAPSMGAVYVTSFCAVNA